MLKRAGYNDKRGSGAVPVVWFLKRLPLYLMFGRKSVAQEDVEKFDAALESMKADSAYDRILNQYLQTLSQR